MPNQLTLPINAPSTRRTTRRKFGIECEVSGGGEDLACALYAAGLTANDYPCTYHCRCEACDPYVDRPWPFTLQEDCTVDVEVISKVLWWGLSSAERHIDQLADCLRESRAVVAENAGNHVHVSSEDMDHHAKHNLWRLFLRYQDHLDAIARGRFGYVRSYNAKCYAASRTFWLDPDHRSNQVAGTWLSQRVSTFEFRLWNATRAGWRLKLHAGLSVAMVEAAIALSAADDYIEFEDRRTFAEVVLPFADDGTIERYHRQLAFVKDIGGAIAA